MNWQHKPVQEKSCACCHQLLLRSKRAILIRAWEKWKEDTKVRIHWVGWQVVLCRSCFSLSPGEKRAWSHTSSLFALKGHWRKVQNRQSFHFVGVVVLHCVLGSYHIKGHVGKKGTIWSSQKAVHGEAPSALTKDQVCTKVPSGAFALLCTRQCLLQKITVLVKWLIGV